MIKTIIIFIIIFILLSVVKTFFKMSRLKSGSNKNVNTGNKKSDSKKDDGNIVDAKYEEIN
ncbi:MAG TPA: hypothetical protein PK294_11765 [Ignavibacteria bacterium]|nr:hypothetical protein [Ignavibacteria bacterium]HQY53063.1 hypothetical protein [Ignavibacteria bacterium]HRB01104.1 hypothetical protein [Ignavibacteria bacterium]